MMLSGSPGADALTAITTLGFTFMALDCFDALLNWTNEHSLVKAIVSGSGSDAFSDEQHRLAVKGRQHTAVLILPRMGHCLVALRWS